MRFVCTVEEQPKLVISTKLLGFEIFYTIFGNAACYTTKNVSYNFFEGEEGKLHAYLSTFQLVLTAQYNLRVEHRSKNSLGSYIRPM